MLRRIGPEILDWAHQRRHLGAAMLAIGPLLIGVNLAIATAGTITPQTLAKTTTLHQTIVERHTKLITIRVKGRVIGHHDHVLVVLVPRTVFHTRTRRVVVPRHVVRIHQPSPTFGVTSAVIGVAPPPTTVYATITVPVTVPGPTTTVTETQTLPPETVTETVTVTVPLLPEEGSQ